ncbi:hypothetical protein [Nannocystis pusilla]|uniref:hypothetical protein n=1 Tax=Nannocystis pusilla TaxID=889268 RepID=UPI003BF1F7B8
MARGSASASQRSDPAYETHALADDFGWGGRAGAPTKHSGRERMKGICPNIRARDGDEARDTLLSLVPARREFIGGANEARLLRQERGCVGAVRTSEPVRVRSNDLAGFDHRFLAGAP